MFNKLKGIFKFDQLVWDVVQRNGEFSTVSLNLRVGPGYKTEATSRRDMQAFGYALREIADKIVADNQPN